MFGSRREPRLMDGRTVIWRAPSSGGEPLVAIMSDLVKLLASRADKADLMIGYWEYGDEIVVTAPEEKKL